MAASKSEKFRCPHCHSLLTKSPAAQLLGEAGNYLAFGRPISCPACTRGIDAQKLIDGEYDLPKDSALVTLVALVVLFGGPFVLHLKFNLALGWSLLLPWVTLILLGLLFGLARKPVTR